MCLGETMLCSSNLVAATFLRGNLGTSMEREHYLTLEIHFNINLDPSLNPGSAT